MKSLFFWLLVMLMLVWGGYEATAGTGAIPKGPDVLLLKPNLLFKGGDTKIMTNDPDDPKVVAKDAELGSAYIEDDTGFWFRKEDNGSSTNWINFLFASLGTDECVPRWDGTAVPLLQDSLFCITDLGYGTGLTGLDVDNLTLDGNTLSSSDANGPINLTPNGTGEVVASTLEVTDLTDSRAIIADGANGLVTNNIEINTSDEILNVTRLRVDNLQMDANGIISTNANGPISLTPNGTGEVIASTLTVSDLTAFRMVYEGGAGLQTNGITISNSDELSAITRLTVDNLELNGNTIQSLDVNGNIVLDPNGTGNVNLPDLTISQPAYIDASGNLVSQDINLTSDVTGVLPIANGGTNSSTALNNNRHMISSGGSIVEHSALTAGSIFFGDANGLLDESANLTWDDTLNIMDVVGQFNIDNITIDGNTISSSDVNGNIVLDPNGTGSVNLPDLAVSQYVVTDASSNLTTVAGLSASDITSTTVQDGELLIGNDAGDNFVEASLTGTANQITVTNGPGSITLSTPQDIHTGASPTFAGVTAGNLNMTANTLSSTNVNGNITIDPVGSGKFITVSTSAGSVPAPAMTETERNNIVGPTAGDQVFNLTSGYLNVYNGTAWITLAGPELPLLAKGSLVTSDGVGNGELTVGADDQILVADSAETSGLKWIDLPASGSRLNLLNDGSFEAGVTDGSCTGCTATQDTTDKLGTDNNLASLKMAFSASSGDYTLTKSTSAQYSNVAGVVSAWIKTSASDCHFDELVDGTQSQTVAIGSSDEWKQYIINGTTGTTSYGWRVRCDTAITDDVFVDETFTGAATADTFDIGTASLWGSGKWEYTAAVCNWAVSSSTFASPAADTDCDTPELKGNYTQVASTNIPALKFSYLKAGSYKIIAKTARMYKNTSVSNNCGVRFFDGTNASSPMQYGTTGATETQNPVVVGQFDYTTDQNDITFELQFLSNSGGNCGIYLSDSANYNGMEISVYHYPSPQKVVAAKCDGLSCTNEFSAKISSSNVITNENVDWLTTSSESTNIFTVLFQSGLFSVAPNCSAVPKDGTSNTKCNAYSESTSQVSIACRNVGGSSDSAVNVDMMLYCSRGSDYKQFDQRFVPVVDEFSSDWETYTPTITGCGTPTNVEFKKRRDGADLLVDFSFTCGTSTAVTPKFSIPETPVSNTALKLVGVAHVAATSGTGYTNTAPLYVQTGGTAEVVYQNNSTVSLEAETDATNIMNSGNNIAGFVRVPISGWSTGKTAFIGNLTPKEFVQTPGSTKPVIHSCDVDLNSGTPVNGSGLCSLWVDSYTDNGDGDVTINLISGKFSAEPTCTFSSNTNDQLINFALVSKSASAIRIRVRQNTTLTDYDFGIICHGVQ